MRHFNTVPFFLEAKNGGSLISKDIDTFPLPLMLPVAFMIFPTCPYAFHCSSPILLPKASSVALYLFCSQKVSSVAKASSFAYVTFCCPRLVLLPKTILLFKLVLLPKNTPLITISSVAQRTFCCSRLVLLPKGHSVAQG